MMIIPMLISTTMGWFGWAISGHNVDPWIGPTIFYSLINFGQAVGTLAYVFILSGVTKITYLCVYAPW